jgi:uncharacterized protein (TIGR01777 family)
MPPVELGTIAVSGSSGLVGTALLQELRGARVQRIVRSRAGSRDDANGLVVWDPQRGSIDAARLNQCDVVVHLAGEPIAARRWNPKVKQRILRSRVDGTRLLARTVTRLAHPPRVLVSASAIGFYGDRGDEILTEDSSPGTGYLPEVARAWEEEAARAASAGIRVVVLRFGIILSAEGGALKKMLTPFRLGAGGPLGSGRQWMSWVHISDVAGVIRRAIEGGSLAGPVNVVAPEPVRNDDFARALGRALHRPAALRAPAFALRLALGEMADALLLSSQRVAPQRLLADGYPFRFSSLESALADLLG